MDDQPQPVAPAIAPPEAREAELGDGQHLGLLAQAVARNLEMTSALAARVEAVAADVGYLTSLLAVGPPAGAPTAVPADLLALPTRFEGIVAMVDDVRLRMGDLPALGDRIDRVETLLTAVAAHLAAAGDPGGGAAGGGAAGGGGPADLGADLALVVRTELTGLRQGMRSAIDAAAGELRGLAEDRRDAVAGLVDTLTGEVDRVADTVDRTGETIDRLGAAVALQGRDLAEQIQEATASMLAEQLNALDGRQGVLEDGLRAIWTRLDDVDDHLTHAAPEAVEAAVGAAVGAAAASLGPPSDAVIADLISALDSGLGEVAQTAGRAAADQVAGVLDELTTGVLAQVAAALDEVTTTLADARDARDDGGPAEPEDGVRPTAVIDGDVLDELVQTAVDAISDALADRLSAASPLAEVVGQAVSDALDHGLEALALDRAAPAPDPVTTGFVDAIAGTLDEFGDRVDGELASIGQRLEGLNGLLHQLVAGVEAAVSQRRSGSGDALGLLRRVAVETAPGSPSPPTAGEDAGDCDHGNAAGAPAAGARPAQRRKRSATSSSRSSDATAAKRT